MLHRFLCAGLVVGLAAACHSEQPGPTECPAGPVASLVGHWQLVRSVGGLTGRQVVYPARPVIDMFAADSTYQRCEAGQCSTPVGFAVRTGRSSFTGQLAPLLRRGDLAAYQLVSVTDSLVIRQELADGFTEYYVRLPR